MAGLLEERLIALGCQSYWFDEAHAQDIEDLAHTCMRQIAIRQMEADLAKHDTSDPNYNTLSDDIAAQRKIKVWSDDRHFIALAKALGCKAVMRRDAESIGPNETIQNAIELYTATPHAATLDLCHTSGNHWIRSSHVKQNKAYYSTNPDGNCLYRAAAQELHRLVQQERQQLSATSHDTSSRSVSPSPSRDGSPSVNSPRLSSKASVLQQAILDKANDFKTTLNSLTSQDSKVLEEDYCTCRIPCSKSSFTNAAPKVVDARTQEHRDYLLALRLQLEEIEHYRKSSAVHPVQ